MYRLQIWDVENNRYRGLPLQMIDEVTQASAVVTAMHAAGMKVRAIHNHRKTLPARWPAEITIESLRVMVDA